MRLVETAWAAVEADGRRLIVALHTDVTDERTAAREERRGEALRQVRAVTREVAAAGVPAIVRDRLRLVTDAPSDEANLFRGGGRVVLVAGNDRLVLELLRQLLVGHDYLVLVAESGSAATDRLRQACEEVRATVLDFRSRNASVADRLGRVRPRLPVVNVTRPLTAGAILESLVLAIAADELETT